MLEFSSSKTLVAHASLFDLAVSSVILIASMFRRVMEQEQTEGLVPVGQYVTLHIAGVPASFAQRAQHVPLVLFAMLPHENKMSTIHFRLTMHPSYQTPIK